MISTRREGDVGLLMLDRPDKRNALTPEMLAELPGAARRLAQDCRAIVLGGEGRAFCAGFDLKMCAADETGATMRALLEGLGRGVAALRSLDVPVVAAAHGAAIAGGAALLGGADVVVADRGAKIGYPVVRIGVSPAVSAPTLAHAMGAGGARARLLHPEIIDGDEAHARGLVHELVEEHGQVLDRAVAIARSMASKPGEGVVATRRWVNEIESGLTPLGAEAGELALQASLAITGAEDERARLAAMWGDQ